MERNEYGMFSFDDALVLVGQGKATVRYNARLNALVVYESNVNSPTKVTSCAFAPDTPENRGKVSSVGKVTQSNTGY